MKIRELNHVALKVSDVDASVRFFRDVLGLAELPRPAFDFPGAWFRLGERQELHLIGGRVGPPSTGYAQRGHFALLVEDMEEVASRLGRLGARFSGPGPRPDGAIQIFIMDPDGNLIELCSNLPG